VLGLSTAAVSVGAQVACQRAAVTKGRLASDRLALRSQNFAGCFEPEIGARSPAVWRCQRATLVRHRGLWADDLAGALKTEHVT
jgi:hypothetical protein